jgi:hypothetical protein
VIPDFIQWDRDAFWYPNGEANGRKLSPQWLLDIMMVAVVQRRTTVILLPDVLLAELAWGPRTGNRRWPANWRRTIAQAIQAAHPLLEPFSPVTSGGKWSEDGVDLSPAWRKGEADCSPRCLLYGRRGCRPHGHFRVRMPYGALGVMAGFLRPTVLENYLEYEHDDWNTEPMFDFKCHRVSRQEAKHQSLRVHGYIKQVMLERDEFWDMNNQESWRCTPGRLGEYQDRIDELNRELDGIYEGKRRVDGTWASYVLPCILGPSPRVGLSAAQCRILTGVVGEVTRTRSRSARPDRALLVEAGRGGRAAVTRLLSPELPDGKYVLFNGNGSGRKKKLAGNGYRLGTWMGRCGYHGADARAFLKDLEYLSDRFELHVGAYSRAADEWLDLREMLSLWRSARGRARLSECLVRMFTPADYLTRWRSHFAHCLGVRAIPAHAESGGELCVEAGGVRSAKELGRWMREHGYTDVQLAKSLGVDRTTVNHYRTGRRSWSGRFQQKLITWMNGCDIAHRQAADCDESITLSGPTET